MKINEYEYYNNLANWSFDDINYEAENTSTIDPATEYESDDMVVGDSYDQQF